jgi:4-amino-4-deoxy-L-arabinose transferase-like glycosyltransferase
MGLLVLLFLLIRLPGTSLPLHQDEYKWPLIVNPNLESKSEIPHPPLSQFIYRIGGEIVGFNTNFRFIPLFFGAINLVLLYYLMKIVFGKREAFIASIIWIFSYFSVLASLMVDTDGQIMPFFFLLSLIGYYKLQNSIGNKKYIWGSLLLGAMVLGFFIKVSFFLAIGAIIADYLWSKKHLLSKQQVIKYLSVLFGGLLLLGMLLFLAQYVFPFFSLSKSFEYWKHFAVGDRGWFQTLIQCIKAVLYSSPFLILIPFLASKNTISKTRVFIFFLAFSFIFYVVLFDFSIGALDRYLQLLILPLTVITTAVISSTLKSDDRRFLEFLYLGIVVSLVLVLLQSLTHYVPSLHPKSDWIGRAINLRWNFLYPFSGGSGPLGFYVSFLFMALAWLISFAGVVLAIFKINNKKLIIVFLIPLGFAYNAVFVSEYLFGFWNGSAPRLLAPVVEYIKNNPDVKMVTVYNDNGGNEIA